MGQERLSEWLQRHEQCIKEYWWEGMSPDDCARFIRNAIKRHDLIDDSMEVNIYCLPVTERQ